MLFNLILGNKDTSGGESSKEVFSLNVCGPIAVILTPQMLLTNGSIKELSHPFSKCNDPCKLSL